MVPSPLSVITVGVYGAYARSERIFQVALIGDLLGCRIDYQTDDIKPYVFVYLVVFDICVCCCRHTLFLGLVHIFFRRLTSKRRRAGLDFGKNNLFAVLGYQVHFEVSHPPVAFGDTEPFGFQYLSGFALA